MRPLLFLLLSLACVTPLGAQNPREKKVRDDKVKVEADGFWIYNNLPKAYDEAKQSGKPIIVVLRCIPCEECVKLDDDLVDKDETLRPLLNKFVRVRVVSTNNLDLSLFQYDYDQSFAVFFLNADQTIYGRFGTRSHRTNWVGDVSIQGLAKAMQGALEIHKDAAKYKEVLAAKRGPAPLFPVPEKFPSLSGKYGPKLNYEGNVVQSCIHCHQIGDAIKETYRKKKEALPDDVLFPYPHPKSQGLILDPKERATVEKVEAGTSASQAGFKAGDVIRTLNGQPLLALADVQWVLHHTPSTGGDVMADVLRDGKAVTLKWSLAKGWKTADNISWRSSSWGLRRMATGGMLLEDLEAKDLPASVAKGALALRVKHVGAFGAHAAAKNAGVQQGDILISFDGKTDLKRETDIFLHALQNRKAGDKVPLTLLRNGKEVKVTIPMQE